ncbi:hypothetical protein FGO68_gene14865 [Halteria grandinella]|uniref:Uncharacterized protein n=1 Tax=Halteria grandinella TaxID=5974 RepID=A0A8J8NPC6_HALGN|nr:hypothetical protein FGO68_gene14865 [Halteria grandinella]
MGCVPEDKKNFIDFDSGETTFDHDHVLKFENAFYITKIMLNIWGKMTSRAKAKYSPRSIVARYPPLDPGIANLRDQNGDKTKQKNWTLVVRELKKFEIEINAVIRDMLIGGDHILLSKLVHMLINYDQQNGYMNISRVLEHDLPEDALLGEPSVQEIENGRRSAMSSAYSLLGGRNNRGGLVTPGSVSMARGSIKNGSFASPLQQHTDFANLFAKSLKKGVGKKKQGMMMGGRNGSRDQRLTEPLHKPREMYTDLLIKRLLEIPSCNQYNIRHPNKRIPLGKISNFSPGHDVLHSDVHFRSLQTPAPSTYTPKKESFMKSLGNVQKLVVDSGYLESMRRRSRSNSPTMPLPHLRTQTCFFNKPQTPGVGTYNVSRSSSKIQSRNPQYSMGKYKAPSFAEAYAKTHSQLPGIGTYQVAKCYQKIYRPYTKKFLLP